MWPTEESRRLKTMAVLVVVIIALLLLRLLWLQLLQGAQYKKIAEDNRVRSIPAQAPRGSIYDRGGALLAASRPSFAVAVIPAEYVAPTVSTPLLARITGVAEAEIERLVAGGRETALSPVMIKRDIDPVMMAQIDEQKADLAGVVVAAVPVRQYVYKELAAHVLGYIGAISDEEYAFRKGKGYRPDDLIGKDGLERVWEETLRGTDGGRRIEVNSAGEELRVIGEQPPIPGNGIVLTLDANLQRAAEDALAAQMEASRGMGEPSGGGAAVVLDVNTGQVLALASLPSFDPNAFAAGIRSKDWNALLQNRHDPLTNRAIQSAYPPGSVFKIVTAAAALDLGKTTPDEIFEDRGVYLLNGWEFYGWETKGLGRLNLVDGIAMSSDPVFYELGRRIGVDSLAAYALTFGFGQKSGIGLPGETEGNVPTTEWKEAQYHEEWYPGETLIAAIGQGYYLATPLQQALLMMAVANSGVIYSPYLVMGVLSPDGQVRERPGSEVRRTVYLSQNIWDILRQGLKAVVARGTAAGPLAGLPVAVAGKTGSAETGTGTVHSWFACYAPADNPRIAMAVFVEEGGEGSVSAVPVSRKILEAYFALPAAP